MHFRSKGNGSFFPGKVREIRNQIVVWTMFWDKINLPIPFFNKHLLKPYLDNKPWYESPNYFKILIYMSHIWKNPIYGSQIWKHQTWESYLKKIHIWKPYLENISVEGSYTSIILPYKIPISGQPTHIWEKYLARKPRLGAI